MPYRHAHWYLLALFPLAGMAFWQGYLSQIRTASFEFHAHGVTATLWLILLAAQSWTIRHGQRPLHRAMGTTSLVLFPLFLAGGTGIFIGMARRYVEGSPFHAMYAPNLAWLDFVAVGGVAYFYYQALVQRRKVHPHSRYLLATAIFLLPPILGRLSPILPGLSVAGPQDFWKLETGFQIANGVTAVIAFALAIHSGKHGRPFFLAGVLTLFAALLFQAVGNMEWWEGAYARVAELPTTPLALAAALAGAIIAYAGWTRGRRTIAPVEAVPV
jgi:hypothetical protein